MVIWGFGHMYAGNIETKQHGNFGVLPTTYYYYIILF